MRYTFVLFGHLWKLNVKLLRNFWSKTHTLQFMTTHISVFPNKRHDIFGDSNIRLTLWDQSRGCGNNVHYSKLTSMRQFTPDFRHSHRELMYEVYNSWEIVAQIQTCLAWLFWIEQFHDMSCSFSKLFCCLIWSNTNTIQKIYQHLFIIFALKIKSNMNFSNIGNIWQHTIVMN